MNTANYLAWKTINYSAKLGGIVGLISVYQASTAREAILKGTLGVVLYVCGSVIGDATEQQRAADKSKLEKTAQQPLAETSSHR